MKESERVLLRTSADIIERALTQAKCLSDEFPQYQRDVAALEDFSARLSEDAAREGRIGRATSGRR